MAEPRIFVYYCGGCVPRYDRVKAVHNLLEQIGGSEAAREEVSDAAILVCGCPARCTRLPEIPSPRLGSYTLASLTDFDNLLRTLKEKL